MKRIYFRADAGPQIGYGHFIRSLALADMLKGLAECTFFSQCPSEYQMQLAADICPLVSLPNSIEKFDFFLKFLSGNEIVILDNYFYDLDYQNEIKSLDCKLIYIDDRRGQKYFSDVVINHVVGVGKEDIISPEYTTYLLGPKYALLRKSFQNAMYGSTFYNGTSNQVLIAMGGADFHNIALKLAVMLLNTTNYEINILIGDSYKFEESLKPLPVSIFKNISANQLIELIRKQKMAITPPSTLSYEVSAVGCPLLVGFFTEEQKNVAQALEDSQIAISCGDFRTLTDNIFLYAMNKVIQKQDSILLNQREIFDGNQTERFQTFFKQIL